MELIPEEVKIGEESNTEKSRLNRWLSRFIEVPDKNMEKVLKVTDILSESAGIFQDILKPLGQLFIPDPIDEIKSYVNTKPSIQQTVDNISNIKDVVEEIDIQSITDLSKEIGKKLEIFRGNLLIRDILNTLLLDIQVFTNGLQQNKEIMQKIQHRISEILYSNYQDTIDIIENKKLPIITETRDDDGLSHPFGNPTLAITFNCGKNANHEFIIFQTSPGLIDKVKEILTLAADDFSRLTNYQFALLYLQLIHIKRDQDNTISEIDNIFTAFYDTNGRTCNLCPPE